MSESILAAPLPTEILVVRHAEVHNPNDILYGRLPRFRLSERGREQAEATGAFISGRPVTAIYTSPLLRARQTAEILSHYHPGLPVRASRRLIEVKTGHQGSPNSIIKPGFTFYHPRKHPDDETMEDVFARVLGFLRIAARRHAGESIVAVSHADPIVITRMGLTGIPFTAKDMHATVYPERSSVSRIWLQPGEPLELSYFNVAAQTRLAA